MKIRLAVSQSNTLADASMEIFEQLGDIDPCLLLIGFNAVLSGEELSSALAERYSCPALGASSCRGVLGINDRYGDSRAALAVMAIMDSSGHYGVGHCQVGDDPLGSAQTALDMALYASGRGYESPALIWCMLPPGQEESILAGFVSVVGPHVPILGGSSGDDDVSGNWQQFTDLHADADQITVAVLYPSSPVSVFFSSGYQSSGITAVVTAVDGRNLLNLNSQPAADYYDQLTDGLVQDCAASNDLLLKSTMYPLGRNIHSPASVDEFVLSHPYQVSEQGGILLFSKVDLGDELHLMKTTKDNLIARAERVVFSAINMLPEGREPVGVLLIYCAGCMLAIEDRIDEVAESIASRFPGLPILGWYTFGEQGSFLDGEVRHGNLMISAAVLSQ